MTEKQKKQGQESDNGQHYARFDVELLLHDDNRVRRTKVRHRPDGEEKDWSGWQRELLLNFMAKEAGIPKAKKTTTLAWQPEDEKIFWEALQTKVVPQNQTSPKRVLHHDQLFDVQLAIDLSTVQAPRNATFFYNAAVYAKDLQTGKRQKMGIEQGEAKAKKLAFSLPSAKLQPGTYRLQVELDLALQPPQQASVRQTLAGGLLQVQ